MTVVGLFACVASTANQIWSDHTHTVLKQQISWVFEWETLTGTDWHFEKYVYLLSCAELNENIDITSLYGQNVAVASSQLA